MPWTLKAKILCIYHVIFAYPYRVTSIHACLLWPATISAWVPYDVMASVVVIQQYTSCIIKLKMMRFLYFLTETATRIFSLYTNFVAIFLLQMTSWIGLCT